MKLAIAVAVGLVVFFLFFALIAEQSRRQAEQRRELISFQQTGSQYQSTTDRALKRIIQWHENLQLQLISRYPLASRINENLFYAELSGGVIVLSLGVFLFISVLYLLMIYAGLAPLIASFLGLIFAPGVSIYWILHRIKHRRDLFQQQLPEFLLLIASSLRSGLSLMSAIESVSSQGNGEIERQFRRAVREISLGLRVENALDALAERSKSQDMQMVIAALETQREVGGNLSDVLEGVAETARERAELAQEIRVLSSEGRISAVFLTILPIGVFAFFALFNPSYVDVFWTEPIGFVLAAIFFVLIAAGAIWMRILVRIRVR